MVAYKVQKEQMQNNSSSSNNMMMTGSVQTFNFAPIVAPVGRS